jgi:hypothetical protein
MRNKRAKRLKKEIDYNTDIPFTKYHTLGSGQVVTSGIRRAYQLAKRGQEYKEHK